MPVKIKAVLFDMDGVLVEANYVNIRGRINSIEASA